MSTPRILLCLLLTAGITRAQAQDNPAPAPAPAQTEMQKWIATTDAQWQATFNRDVVDIHAAELKKLAAQYAVSLDAVLAKATAAGDLDGAVALRNEQKRFTETNLFPEQDEATDTASVKQIRAATRVQLARIEKENGVRTKALHAKYDAVLAQAQAQLTQAQRLDDALLVKAKREEVAAAWTTPAITAAAEQANAPAPANSPAPATRTVSAKKTGVEFVIEALVDGHSVLHVKPDAMYWESEKASKPGLWEKHNDPTYINGKPWVPHWHTKSRSGPDKSYPTPVPFGTIELEYELLAVTKEKGQSGIEQRSPIEAKVEGQEFVVRIPDAQSEGRWYKFTLRKKQK